MPGEIDRRIAEEIAHRAARRLEILGRERPELLAARLSSWDPDALSELLDLTRLPDRLADREPTRRHLGVSGVDHCTERLVSAEARDADVTHPVEYVDADLAELDDDDLLAARRYIPETIPGNVLG